MENEDIRQTAHQIKGRLSVSTINKRDVLASL